MAESWPSAFAHNLSATADPAVANDISQGYRPGSVWINKTAQRAFICVDGTLGAAVWDNVSGVVADSQVTTINQIGGTLPTNALSGGGTTILVSQSMTPGSLTTPTAAQLLANAPGSLNKSYVLRVCNGSSGQPLTLVGGTGVVITGNGIVQGSTYQDYLVTIASATSATFQPVGSGPYNPELVFTAKPL